VAWQAYPHGATRSLRTGIGTVANRIEDIHNKGLSWFVGHMALTSAC